MNICNLLLNVFLPHLEHGCLFYFFFFSEILLWLYTYMYIAHVHQYSGMTDLDFVSSITNWTSHPSPFSRWQRTSASSYCPGDFCAKHAWKKLYHNVHLYQLNHCCVTSIGYITEVHVHVHLNNKMKIAWLNLT